MCPCLPWYLTAVGLMCHLLSDPNSRNHLCSTLLPFGGLIGSMPWGCFTSLRGLTQTPMLPSTSAPSPLDPAFTSPSQHMTPRLLTLAREEVAGAEAVTGSQRSGPRSSGLPGPQGPVGALTQDSSSRTLSSCSALCGRGWSQPAWELVERPCCLGLHSLGPAWQPRPWG